MLVGAVDQPGTWCTAQATPSPSTACMPWAKQTASHPSPQTPAAAAQSVLCPPFPPRMSFSPSAGPTQRTSNLLALAASKDPEPRADQVLLAGILDQRGWDQEQGGQLELAIVLHDPCKLDLARQGFEGFGV